MLCGCACIITFVSVVSVPTDLHVQKALFYCTRVKLLAASGTKRRPLRKHILRCSLVRAAAKTNICRLSSAFFVIISGAAYQQQITELDEESLALQQSCTPDPF